MSTNMEQPISEVPSTTQNLSQDEQALLHLSKRLKEIVSQAVKELRMQPSKDIVVVPSETNEAIMATPVSFHVPADYSYDHGELMMDKSTQRTKTRLVAEYSTSFKLPEDCLALNLDKLPIAREREPMTPNSYQVCQFSLSERLEGWKIERRQRSNGRFDTYYSHDRSNGSFRSIIEVIDFILYEAYPEKPQVNKGTPEESSARSQRTRSLLFKRKRASDEGEDQRNFKQLLAQEQDNLLISFNDSASQLRLNIDDRSNEDMNSFPVSIEEAMRRVVTEFMAASLDNHNDSSNDNAREGQTEFGLNYRGDKEGSKNDLDELDLINHVPVVDSLDELRDFLVDRRSKRV